MGFSEVKHAGVFSQKVGFGVEMPQNQTIAHPNRTPLVLRGSCFTSQDAGSGWVLLASQDRTVVHAVVHIEVLIVFHASRKASLSTLHSIDLSGLIASA